MGDEMRAKERAWLCAGCGWVERERDAPLLLCAEGERPVLVVPRRWDAEQREAAFGWAATELVEQDGGWLLLVRRLRGLLAGAAKAAGAAALGAPVLARWLCGLCEGVRVAG